MNAVRSAGIAYTAETTPRPETAPDVPSSSPRPPSWCMYTEWNRASVSSAALRLSASRSPEARAASRICDMPESDGRRLTLTSMHALSETPSTPHPSLLVSATESTRGSSRTSAAVSGGTSISWPLVVCSVMEAVTSPLTALSTSTRAVSWNVGSSCAYAAEASASAAAEASSSFNPPRRRRSNY